MSEYTADMTELLTAEPETEPHIVITRDKTVIVPDELKSIATQYEKNIETVTFDCPRYWDEHDLSTMRMYINFRRADGVELPHLCGVPTVDEADENIVHFDWTVGDDVTAIKGKLSFVAVAKKADEDGVLENRWASRLCQDMEILEGIEPNYAEILEPSADIIEQLLYKLDAATEEAVDAADRAIAAAAAAFTSGYISDNANIDNLADGVYEYNGWASGSIVCSAGLPFHKAFGTWIKKTPYNDKSTANRIDTVINNYTGDVYTMYGYNGTWRVNKANPTPADIGAVSGSYTGNGEATARTIETGGIGNCCVVYGGTDHVAYLTPKGAFFHSGGAMAFTSDVSFSNGVITLRNAYIINTANITYNYQVL